MRALKLLGSFVAWRWTPCFALIASSLLYVLIVVLVTPKTFSFGGGPKAVNVIEGPESSNALTTGAGRADRTSTANPRRPAPAAQPAAPSPAPAAPPPQPPQPAEEPHREMPAPPPPPAPPPQPEQPDEEEEPPAPPPAAAPAPNPNARFMATPLRFLPQMASAAAAANSAPTPAPAPSEGR